MRFSRHPRAVPDSVGACPRCSSLAEITTGYFSRPGQGARLESVGHCLSRLCGAFFSLPDPDPKESR